MKFEQKYIKLIQSNFLQYNGMHKLLSIKIIKKILHKIHLIELYQYLSKLPLFSSMDKNDALKQFIRLILNNKFELKRCLVCNTYLSIDYTYADRSYCSIKCKNNDKDRWLEKSKKSCLEKYGVEWSFNSDNNKIKTRQTLLKRYGKETIYEVQEFKEKTKKTNLEKYGTQYYAASIDMKQKKRNTVLKKYGVQCVLSSDIIREKIEKTNLQKYGVKCNLQVPEIRTQIIKTNIQKYGVANPNQSQQIKLRARNKRLKIKIDLILQQNNYTPLFNKEDIGNIQNYTWKCNTCGNIFQFNNFYFHGAMPRCLKCYPHCNGISLQEKQIIDFLRDKIKIKQHDRTIIAPNQLDIVIPSKKIAIEFNGSYYHSISREDKNKDYHLNKTNMCQQNNYHLIHIWQYDWLNKKQLIKNKLLGILNIQQEKIYARKCVIKEINAHQKNIFLIQNHIQGSDKSQIKLGLYYDNKLMAVMTFGKPRFNKNYEWELIRYATKAGYKVLGGAGKLLKYFEKKFNPKNLITYADRSYSKGNMYEKIGFILKQKTLPNYIYTNNKIILSRYQCQKHKLQKLLGKSFNPNLSESQNMWLNRFYKIYDSGNLVYQKIYKLNFI